MLRYPNYLEDKYQLKLKDETTLHPVQKAIKRNLMTQEQIEESIITSVFGLHMPIKLKMEKAILSSYHRLPTLKSEFAGLDSITGKDVELDFCDFLNDPFTNDSEIPNLHMEMERKLGLQTSSQFIN